MTLRILHCVPDDKFVDGMIDTTQALWTDCYQDYVFISRHPERDFKYIQKQEWVKRIGFCEIVNYVKDNYINIVIAHNLYSIPYFDLVKLPDGIKVVWFAWGHDIYRPTYKILRPLIKKELYYEKTRLALKDNWRYLFRLFVSFSFKYRSYFKMKRAIRRIDYFSGVIPEEYDLIVADKHNKHFRAKPLLFNYTSLQFGFSENNIHQPIVSGFDIQLGNSGDPTNNHIDVLNQLKQYNLVDKKICCPISYSGTKYYREQVVECGKHLFGDSFNPLTSFVPLDEYIKITASTRYSIFATERQQAMGNIFTSLWKGRLVFLSETNPAYVSLKKRGFVLFTIQHDLYRIERNEVMKDEDIHKNRMLLIKYYSIDAERKKAKDIISILSN